MRPTLQLLLIAALFLLPFLAAVFMRFGGWQPTTTRNAGELLLPPLSMGEVVATLESGEPWVWENTDRHWTLLLQRPAACAASCQEAVAAMPTIRVALGRHANKLNAFQLDAGGPLEPITLAGTLPLPLVEMPATMPQVWLVDPHGYLVMRYEEGFDPSGLRRDLSRLVK
jgi:hypothetical protein